MIEELPDEATLNSRSGQLELFETELELFGVRMIEPNKYSLPID